MRKVKKLSRQGAVASIILLFAILSMSFRQMEVFSSQDTIQSQTTCPTANFVATGSVFGSPTYFSNLSSETNNCYWDFGDGSSSSEVNPQHTYTSPGTYQVRLVVSANGCTDSYIGTLDVIAD